MPICPISPQPKNPRCCSSTSQPRLAIPFTSFGVCGAPRPSFLPTPALLQDWRLPKATTASNRPTSILTTVARLQVAAALQVPHFLRFEVSPSYLQPIITTRSVLLIFFFLFFLAVCFYHCHYSTSTRLCVLPRAHAAALALLCPAWSTLYSAGTRPRPSANRSLKSTPTCIDILLLVEYTINSGHICDC